MVKNHLKRLKAPKSWDIKRKGIIFATRPNPGSHSLEQGIPLNMIIRDMLGYAKTTREVRKILLENNVLVDGIRRKDTRFCVGLMDTIKFVETKECFRVFINKSGKIDIIPIEENESNLKICKITNKTKVCGKIQLNLFDGRNILLEKDDNYKTGDSILLALPKQEIKNHFKFDKGSSVYLIGGSHIGEIGVIEDITGNKLKCKNKKGDLFETLKRYAFVIGKEKPAIKLA